MQLLVRTVDKISSDKAKNIELTKRGDVIAVKSDDQSWGLQEILYPEWIILSVPDMPDVQAKALLSPETTPLNKPDQPVQKRIFRLDLDALGIALLDAKTGLPAVRKATYDKNQMVVPDGAKFLTEVNAVKEQKPISVDPNAIGAPSDSIGPK